MTTSSTDDLSVEPMTMQDDDKEDSADQVKIIPRLVDSAGQAAMPRGKDNNLNPTSWTVEEVAQFLQINECASLADAFQEQVNVTNKTKMRLRVIYLPVYKLSRIPNDYCNYIFRELTEDNFFQWKKLTL